MNHPPQGQRPPPEKPILRYGYWIEGLPYFLLGAVTAAVGLVTAAFWAVEQWRIGNHLRLVLAAVLMSLLVSTFVIATRHRSRVLVLACLLAWCGVATYVLAGWGWRLPAIGN